MRQRSHEFATEEAFDAARQLKPLVKETRALLGNLATQGSQELNALSPDRHFPLSFPTDGDHRFFRQRQIVRTVSPKINARLGIDGYPDLTVVSATSGYYQRWHCSQRLAPVPLPFSRSEEWLSLNIQNRTNDSPAFRAGMSTGGDVSANVHNVSRPEPPFEGTPPYRYQSAEQVRRIYGSTFAESLALGGLVARGMQALDIDLNTEPAKALFNDWRETLGQEPATADAFWIESTDNYLIWQRAGDGQEASQEGRG